MSSGPMRSYQYNLKLEFGHVLKNFGIRRIGGYAYPIMLEHGTDTATTANACGFGNHVQKNLTLPNLQ